MCVIVCGGVVVYVYIDGLVLMVLMWWIVLLVWFVVEVCDGDEDVVTAALERVYVVKALGDADALRETLMVVSVVFRVLVSEDVVVRMIVVDLIVVLFWDDVMNGGWMYAAKRAGALYKLTMLLKEYATKYDVVVVVMNYVVDSVRENGIGVYGDGVVVMWVMGEFMMSGWRVVSAFGLMWSNCVNARLFFMRCVMCG